MDDMRSVFDAAGESVRVPPGDVGAAMQRGAARRRRRLATRLVAMSVVLVVVGAAAAILGGQDARPVPARIDDVDRLPSRLIPAVTEGPPPPESLASESERADARAVAVAFHALLGSAPRWHLGYQGFERSGESWRVAFVQGTPATRTERELSDHEARLETTLARVETDEMFLERAVDRLEERIDEVRGEKARALRREARVARDRSAELASKVAQVQEELAALEARLRVERVRQPSYDVTVTVVARDGVVSVEDVTTDSPDGPALRSAVGYAEDEDAVDIWGYDYFRPRYWSGGKGTKAVVRVEYLGFWTGPLSAPYEERCRPQVLARGRVVWTMPGPDDPPGATEHWDGPPPSEERRDGLGVSFGVPYEGDVRDLSLWVLCEWRPRQ